ncbi:MULTISPECIES: sialidase family protein [Larkinella]|nr:MULTISPECIES: sialidase family protein [Larkinella]
MRTLFRFCFFFLFLLSFWAAKPIETDQTLAAGKMPVIIADRKGAIHLVFGRNDTVFYASSVDKGKSFSRPVPVAHLPKLVLGATRGPQIAVTDKTVLITAMNQTGNVMAYSMTRASRKWSPAVQINDQPEIAKEGFHAIAGSDDGPFYAVWLDLRGDNHNKIVGSRSTDGGRTWTANQVIYQSPDQTVCECCRVSVAAKGNHVYVMFRNSVNGSRDLYIAGSKDGGKKFLPSQKLGTGTWKLKACPMDGGGIALTKDGQPITVWRRESSLYQCRPGESELLLGQGKNVAIAAVADHWATTWQKDGVIFIQPVNQKPIEVGKGQTPSIAFAGSVMVCTWESEKQVKVASIAL